MSKDNNPRMSKSERMEGQRQKLVEIAQEYLTSSRDAKHEWEDKYKRVWDIVNGKVDWSHKDDEDTKIHVNTAGLALERFVARNKSNLMGPDNWYGVKQRRGLESDLMSPHEAERMIELGFESTDNSTNLSDVLRIGACEYRSTLKVRSEIQEIQIPGASRKQLVIHLDPLPIQDYHLDPEMEDLFEAIETLTDKRNVLKLAAKTPSRLKPYRLEAVKKLEAHTPPNNADQDKKENKGAEQQPQRLGRRTPILVHEFWCTVLNDDGTVMEWESENGEKFELENVVFTMANEREIIRDPEPNPRFNGMSPFVSFPLLRTPGAAWARSFMMPGVDSNRVEDELISALTDGALGEAYNVKVIKEEGLVDKTQADGGVKRGDTIVQNDQLNPGEKILEVAETGKVGQGGLAVLSIIQQIGAQNFMSNILDSSGQLPSKQVRATELVAAQNTISSLEDSITADIEDVGIEKIVEQIFHEMLQNKKHLSDEDLSYIFNKDQKRIDAFKALSPSAAFKQLGYRFRFVGQGFRGIAKTQREAEFMLQLYNMLSANPALQEVFQREFSPNAVIEEVFKGFKIDTSRLKLSAEDAEFERKRQLIAEQAIRQSQAEKGVGQSAPGGGAGNVAKPTQNPEFQPGNGSGLA